MLHIKSVDLESISQESKSWTALLQGMPNQNIFLTYEWVKCWYTIYKDKYRAKILLVYENSELKAILPLCLNRKGGVKYLSFCSGNELFPDHLDLICHQDSRKYIEGIIQYLSKDYSDWHMIVLPFLTIPGRLHNYISENELPFKKIIRMEENAPFISLENGFEEYLKTFKKKKRYNLNREERNLDSQGAKLFKSENDNEIHNDIAVLFELHHKRSQAKEIQSTFTGQSIKNFHNLFAKSTFKKGWIGLYILCIDSKPISALYGFYYNKKFYFYQSGMDPEWEKYSAGKIIVYKVLKKLEKDGCIEFDFLGGEDTYKQFWTKKYRSMESAKIYNNNFIGQLLYYYATFKQKLIKKIKK